LSYIEVIISDQSRLCYTILRVFVEEKLAFFQKAPWYEVLNIVQFLHDECLSGQRSSQQNFEGQINEVLEREKSAYRFIAGILAPLTNEIEMQELEQAARRKDRFAPVAEHVRTALELYSKKPQPDYRNGIKESISAVESAAKIITGLPNATLDEAIKLIDKRHSLHGSFKNGTLKLYGYTSNEGGIRHSLTEATNIDEADARYMLVSCSAFANYLISRYDKQP
jgi:AbiJ N-terminal domain 4